MKNLTLQVKGSAVSGEAAYARGVLWIHLDGETFVYEVPKKESRRGGRAGGQGSHPGEVLAPMPGKIIKILVEPGAQVAAQQVLIVMEAMKMEYTLKAQAEGTVASVNCQAGEQVALGQCLVKMEV
jgi:acetyl/propionyl-CoA carboxylase alpha subunit